MTKIEAEQAKAQFRELLNRVEAGESIIIMRCGRDIAHLVPFREAEAQSDLADEVNRWRKSRKWVKLRGLNVRNAINEGRR